MHLLGLIIMYIITGLIIGALARLVVPGRNPIGLGMTILLGIVGAIAGGLVSYAIGLHGFLTLIVSVVIAALLVAMISGTRRSRSPLTR
jgi:uncharacterized membrane protein YeaQ/YmgE (transglycosylase-associated protein family)